MSELISRQKLIEELGTEIKKQEGYREWGNCAEIYCCNSIIDFCNRLAKWVESQPQADQWIPCSERLPQDEQDILGTTDEGIVEKVWYNKHSKTWYGSPFTRRKTITAWMPLPEPYKGVE